MWRFVLKENIRRFEALLRGAKSDEERQRLRQLVHEAEVDLAELEQASTAEIAQQDKWLNSQAQHAVDRAMAISGAQFASLQVFHEDRQQLIILAQRNLRATFLHHLAGVRPGDGSACGRCLAEEVPASVEDVNGDAGFAPHREAAGEAGFQAVQAVPVPDEQGELVAVLSTYFEAPRRFSEAQTTMMTDFAASVGKKLQAQLGAEPLPTR